MAGISCLFRCQISSIYAAGSLRCFSVLRQHWKSSRSFISLPFSWNGWKPHWFRWMQRVGFHVATRPEGADRLAGRRRRFFFFSVAYQRSDEMIQPAFASSGGLLVERCLRAARRTQIPYEHIVVDNDLHATTTTTDRPIDDGRTTPDRHAQSRLSSIHLTHLEKVTSFLSSSSPLIILGSSSYGDISHAPCLGYLRNSAWILPLYYKDGRRGFWHNNSLGLL